MSSNAFNDLHRAEVRREEQAEIAADERARFEAWWEREGRHHNPFDLRYAFRAGRADAAAEIERLRTALDKALTVCRCAARVIDSSAYQGISDEDCDLEVAVRNWRA